MLTGHAWFIALTSCCCASYLCSWWLLLVFRLRYTQPNGPAICVYAILSPFYHHCGTGDNHYQQHPSYRQRGPHCVPHSPSQRPKGASGLREMRCPLLPASRPAAMPPCYPAMPDIFSQRRAHSPAHPVRRHGARPRLPGDLVPMLLSVTPGPYKPHAFCPAHHAHPPAAQPPLSKQALPPQPTWQYC